MKISLFQSIKNFLNKIFRNKEIQKTTKTEIDFFSFSLLKNTKYVSDIESFLTLSQSFKNQTYFKMYLTNPIVRSFIDTITNLTMDLLGEYKNDNKEIEEYIKKSLRKFNFNRWLRNAIMDYFIFGYTVSLIDFNKFTLNNITYYIVDYQNEMFITEGLSKENGENKFLLDEVIYLSNTNYFWNGISMLLPLISYHNLFSKIIDSLYTNINRFTLPYFIVKIKDPTLNEDYYETYIKEWILNVINGNYTALVYQENSLEIDFIKPDNIIRELINIWSEVDKFIAKSLGVFPALSSGERGGSYATAKTQKDLLLSFLSSFLDEFTEEILNKLVKTLIELKYGLIQGEKIELGYFEIKIEDNKTKNR
ncbi:MAG: phage portal protein family protein [bacterium]